MKRILCFGDSLTEGYYYFGLKLHPYTNKLSQLLKENGKTDVQVYNFGVSGESTEEMERRLPKILAIVYFLLIIII